MLFVCHPKILHKHCLQFLLGVKMAPRETENNAYAKFWGDKQRALWYVMVFSGVANSHYFLSLFFCCVGGVTEDAPMVILLVTTTTKFSATVSGHSKCAAMILHTESLAIELSLTVRHYSQPVYVT